MPPHVLCGLHSPPSWAWQECNWLLRLGRPWGAVTLSRWCVSGDRGGCSARRGHKPKFYLPTQTMVTAGIFPFKDNSHGRTGNRTRDLMISSQKLWPVDHEAGPLQSLLEQPCECTILRKNSPEISLLRCNNVQSCGWITFLTKHLPSSRSNLKMETA